MNDTHAKCIGYQPEGAPWRDAAPAHHDGELVPYLRQLAVRLSADLKVRKEDLAYWQAADRIEELCAALGRLRSQIIGWGDDGQIEALADDMKAASTALARARGEA